MANKQPVNNLKRINEKRAENAAKAAAYDDIKAGKSVIAAPPSQEQVQDMFLRWRFHPDLYFKEYLRIHLSVNNYNLTSQQRALAEGVGKLVKYNYSLQALKNGEIQAIPESLAGMTKMTGVSCMAGVGVGKDAYAAMTILWMLDSFPDGTKIFCLAPRQEHLKTVLWPEVRKWYNLRQVNGEHCYLGRESLLIEAEQISRVNTKGEKVSFCSQLVIPKSSDADELKAMLSGKHADDMMFIIDEASAIPDAVLDPLENTGTGRNNFILAIFNPRRNKGWAVETQMPNNSKWMKFNWSQEDCELITPERIKELEDKFGGRHTDGYRVNVLGLPPVGGDADVLIPYSVAIECVMREPPENNTAPRLLGCDIARGGPDDIILALRQGYNVEPLVRCPKMDGVDCADHIIEQAERLDVDAIFIDEAGVGGTVYDLVRRRFKDTYGVNVGRQAQSMDRFHLLRDELIWRCREWMMSGFVTLPDDKELLAQMTDIYYSTDTGRVKVEQKKSMKKRMGGSPDEFEALYLTFFKKEGRFIRGQGGAAPVEDRYTRKLRQMEADSRQGRLRWMSAGRTRY